MSKLLWNDSQRKSHNHHSFKQKHKNLNPLNSPCCFRSKPCLLVVLQQLCLIQLYSKSFPSLSFSPPAFNVALWDACSSMMVTHVSLQLSPQLKPDSPQSSHFLGWAYSACPVLRHSSCSNDPSSVPTGQPLSSPSPPILTPSHAYFSCPFPLPSMTLPLTVRSIPNSNPCYLVPIISIQKGDLYNIEPLNNLPSSRSIYYHSTMLNLTKLPLLKTWGKEKVSLSDLADSLSVVIRFQRAATAGCGNRTLAAGR